MIKKEKLVKKMNKKGIDVSLLADLMGISREELFQKLCGEKEFFASEIYTLGKLLRLSSNELEDIFFAKAVPSHSTKMNKGGEKMFLYGALKYEPIREILQSEDIGEYVSFGIRVINSSGEEITRYGDVSVDEKTVIELCSKCTDFQIDPIHLLDVIEDTIQL